MSPNWQGETKKQIQINLIIIYQQNVVENFFEDSWWKSGTKNHTEIHIRQQKRKKESGGGTGSD